MVRLFVASLLLLSLTLPAQAQERKSLLQKFKQHAHPAQDGKAKPGLSLGIRVSDLEKELQGLTLQIQQLQDIVQDGKRKYTRINFGDGSGWVSDPKMAPLSPFCECGRFCECGKECTCGGEQKAPPPRPPQEQRFSGHRVKALKEKIKARRAKVKPKTPDVKPVGPVKPVAQPAPKKEYHGRFFNRNRRWVHRPSHPRTPADQLPGPSFKLPPPGVPKYIVPPGGPMKMPAPKPAPKP